MLIPSDKSSSIPLRLYQKEASVLLLGFDGAGKKTLSIIASIALRRQYVEFDRYFTKEIGCSPSEYIASHSPVAYYEVLPKVLRTLLDKHSLNCVISGLPQTGAKAQKELLKSFATTNPVIYIQRARSDIGYLSNRSEKLDRLYNALDNFYRNCSNFDYFNITQAIAEDTTATSTLKLKQVERDFVRFLYRMFGKPLGLSHSQDPFSASYTYALQVSLEQLESNFDFSDLECGADVVNLVVDPTKEGLQHRLVYQIAVLRKKTKLPIVVDIFHSDLAAYLITLSLGLRCLPDGLTVSLSVDQSVINAINYSKGFVKLIGTYHHHESWKVFNESDKFFRLQSTAAKLSLQALRISAEAYARDDNLDSSEFAHFMNRAFSIPITAFNTGPLGRTSICFNKVLSPVVMPSSPEGVTVQQARSARHLSFMLESLKFTILGSSVSYSLSPAMHNAAYQACGLPHAYRIHQSERFEDIQLLLDDECGGVTVSMPFKTQVLSILDFISPEARQIGAVNTVVVNHQHGSKTLKGYNTDHIGLRECITNHLSPANSIRASSTALILGAGGMARAAIYAIQTLGVNNIVICNRTRTRAIELAEKHANIHVIDIEEDWPSGLEQPTIIISTIPAHQINNTPAHELQIPEGWLKSTSGGTFIELAYKPLLTRFIKQMNQIRGWIVVDGLTVLLEQGVAQFELFTGTPAPVNIMRSALRRQFATASAIQSPISDHSPDT